jgi:hypothetical protein
MTMLDILNRRLPDCITVVNYKEKSSKFIITFLYDGKEINGELPKNCAPGKEKEICDFTIQTLMTSYMLNSGDLEGAKIWKDYALSRKKMGRPKSNNPKEIKYSIRTDEETEKRLERYCEEYNITKGEAYRKGLNLLLEQVGI